MSSETNNVDDKIGEWVEVALKNENVKNVSFQITDRNKPGDGYVSEIVYVDVNAEKSTGENCQYYLAIKVTKEEKGIFQDFVEFNVLFKREICVYSKLVSAYQQLLTEHGLGTIDFMPKCYWTSTGDSCDVLVFENLKKSGYKLHQRNINMDDDHIQLVLQAYGRWHALSFALRYHHGETFKQIADELTSYEKKIESKRKTLGGDKYKEIFKKFMAERYKVFTDNNEIELLEKYKERTKDIIPGELKEILPDESECVIIHGDCWNNNFLFGYEENDSQKPSKVSLIDFQLSKLQSPVRDLSYFLYSVSSEQELNHFKDYMDVYYSEFASYLTKLGCDPEVIFPRSTLMRHWKEYAIMGFQMGVGVMKLCLSDDKGIGDGGGVQNLNWKLERNKEQYESRLIACTRHLLDNDF